MLVEKWKEVFSKDGNSKKKVENLIFLLVILIVTILAINYIWSDQQKDKEGNTKDTQQTVNPIEHEEVGENNQLENKLEEILSQLEGVGKVDVLLTYSQSTEVVPVYNTSEKVTNTTEGDAGGGKRTIQESDINQEVVYEDKNGDGKVAVQKEISPKIEGAVIIATGADNAGVKANIVQAVEAATGLATHKIQVFDRQK